MDLAVGFLIEEESPTEDKFSTAGLVLLVNRCRYWKNLGTEYSTQDSLVLHIKGYARLVGTVLCCLWFWTGFYAGKCASTGTGFFFQQFDTIVYEKVELISPNLYVFDFYFVSYLRG